VAGADPGFVGLEAFFKFWGPSLRKRIQNYEYKTRYVREYLFRALRRALEGARASERP